MSSPVVTTISRLKGKLVTLGDTTNTEYLFAHNRGSWFQVAQIRSAGDNSVCQVGTVLSGTTATLLELKVVNQNTFEVLFSSPPGNSSFILELITGVGDELES